MKINKFKLISSFLALSSLSLLSLSIYSCSSKNEDSVNPIDEKSSIIDINNWPEMQEVTENPLLATNITIKQIEDLLIVGTRVQKIEYKKELDNKDSKSLMTLLSNNLIITQEDISINPEADIPDNISIKDIEYKKIGNQLENRVKLKFKLELDNKNRIVQLIIKNTDIEEIYNNFFNNESYSFDKDFFVSDSEDSILNDINVTDT